MAQRRHRRNGRGSIWLTLLVLSFMTSFATGSAQMLWNGGKRVATGEGQECMAIRAITASRLRVHCHETGFEQITLSNMIAPDFLDPKCSQEFYDGLVGWWFLQTELSRARSQNLRISFFKFSASLEEDEPRKATLYLDDVNIADRMIDEGHAVKSSRIRRNGWCVSSGQIIEEWLQDAPIASEDPDIETVPKKRISTIDPIR